MDWSAFSGQVEENRERAQPSSASDSILPKPRLCFSFRVRFLFSARLTGGGVPSTARDAAFTTLVARNFLDFFFAMKRYLTIQNEGGRSFD